MFFMFYEVDLVLFYEAFEVKEILPQPVHISDQDFVERIGCPSVDFVGTTWKVSLNVWPPVKANMYVK